MTATKTVTPSPPFHSPGTPDILLDICHLGYTHWAAHLTVINPVPYIPKKREEGLKVRLVLKLSERDLVIAYVCTMYIHTYYWLSGTVETFQRFCIHSYRHLHIHKTRNKRQLAPTVTQSLDFTNRPFCMLLTKVLASTLEITTEVTTL